MAFVDLVKETREELKLTQRDVALTVGVSQGVWSKYENRELPIPNDIANKLTKVFKSPRVKAEYVFQERGEFFNVPILNNVDDNSIVVLESLIEESAELIKSCQELKKLLKNKKDRSELTYEEWEKVMDCEEQIADIFPALKLHFIKMVEEFDLDLELLEKRIQTKLRTKNYIK